MSSQQTLLSPDVLRALGRLELIARTVVEGFLTGLHRSPFHGPSQDFAKHRPYLPGDELRRIDWRVFARTDRLYIKEFDDETGAPIRILLDTSGSLGFESSGISKVLYAKYLAAALSYLAIRQNDRVGLYCFGTAAARLPARGGQRHLYMLLSRLEKVEAAGSARIGPMLLSEAEGWRRRGLAILISDLYDEPREVIDAVARVRRAGHDLIIFHLLAGAEKQLALRGMIEFRDLETGQSLVADADAVRREYRERLGASCALYRAEFLKTGTDYCELDTGEPLDRALTTFLRHRQMGGR